MRPFNLEEALAGKPVVTRDGRPVTEIYYFKTAEDDSQNVIAVIGGTKHSFDDNGPFYGSGEYKLDLFMAPESIEVWVNVFKRPSGEFTVSSHIIEEDAIIQKSSFKSITFIKTEKITIEL